MRLFTVADLVDQFIVAIFSQLSELLKAGSCTCMLYFELPRPMSLFKTTCLLSRVQIDFYMLIITFVFIGHLYNAINTVRFYSLYWDWFNIDIYFEHVEATLMIVLSF